MVRASLVAAVLMLTGCEAASAQPSCQPLANAFRAAHGRADIVAMEALVYWGHDAPAAERETFRRMVQWDLRNRVNAVRFVPLEPDEVLSYERDGIRYVPSLPPAMRMEVDLEPTSEERRGGMTANSSGFLVGVRGGRCWIATALPEGR